MSFIFALLAGLLIIVVVGAFAVLVALLGYFLGDVFNDIFDIGEL